MIGDSPGLAETEQDWKLGGEEVQRYRPRQLETGGRVLESGERGRLEDLSICGMVRARIWGSARGSVEDRRFKLISSARVDLLFSFKHHTWRHAQRISRDM